MVVYDPPTGIAPSPTAIAAIEARNQPLIEWAQSLVIDSTETLEAAEVKIVTIIEAEKQVEAEFRPGIAAANNAHVVGLAQLNKYKKPLGAARVIAKGKTATYRADQERARRVEEERLRAEARQQEEERQLAEAARLEAGGKREEADAVIEQPVETPPIVLAPTVPKAQGVTYRVVWKARVIDKNRMPYAYLEPNLVALGQLARSLRGQARVPGVEFYSEKL